MKWTGRVARIGDRKFVHNFGLKAERKT